MKFIKGARTWRSILGTQTVFWPLTHPPTPLPPVQYQPATKQRPGCSPSFAWQYNSKGTLATERRPEDRRQSTCNGKRECGTVKRTGCRIGCPGPRNGGLYKSPTAPNRIPSSRTKRFHSFHQVVHGVADTTAWPGTNAHPSHEYQGWGKFGLRGGGEGSRWSPFSRPPPPLQASCDGDPRRANGGRWGGGGGGGRGGTPT